MNNDTGGDRPMPGTRMRRLFDENLSMIETMTRIEIRRLGRMPRGTHLGQDDENPVTDLLPDRYLDRYDREFLYRMLGSTIRLRARLSDPTANHAAHSVIEEILISRAVRLVADDDNEEGSGLEAWLEDWLGDLDIDRLYDPAADEATLASDPATGSGDMRFDHWFEDQYWADETDGGNDGRRTPQGHPPRPRMPRHPHPPDHRMRDHAANGMAVDHHRRPRPRPARHVRQTHHPRRPQVNPVTGAVPPLIRGHGIRFEVDRWTWRRLDAARFDGERRHLLATRGRPWHADPRRGGDTDALETWHLLAGRHHGGGMGLTVTGPGGKLDVSWEPDGAIPPDGRFYPNPDPPAAYPLLELERAGIIRPVEPAITVYGPYGRPTRLMEVTEPYHNPMLRALRMR